MSKWRALTVVLVVPGVAFIALAVYYWLTPAGSLPGFFPGYQAASAHVHVKHGIASLVVGLLFLLAAWMSSARK